MPKLFDLNKACAIAEISAEDLARLHAALEQKKCGNAECLLTRKALEQLQAQDTSGPSQLSQLLAAALGANESLPLGIGDCDPSKPCRIHGRILDKGQPCACCKIEAYDEHPVADAWLGAAFTEQDGTFSLAFDDREFRGGAEKLLVTVNRWQKDSHQELLRLAPQNISGKEINLGDTDLSD